MVKRGKYGGGCGFAMARITAHDPAAQCNPCNFTVQTTVSRLNNNVAR